MGYVMDARVGVVRMIRTVMIFLAAGIVLGGCEAALSEPEAFPPGDCGPNATADISPNEKGPFNVGYRSMSTTYTLPSDGSERTVTVNVWYPTKSEEGDGARYVGMWPDKAVFTDAPPAAPLSKCGFPLLAYSHGHVGWGGTGAFMMRHFASHGWVAVAPDHKQNTVIDNVDPRPTSIYFARSMDVSRSIDLFDALPAGDPLANKVATDRVVMTGHSFGAFTTWANAGAGFDMAGIQAGCAEGGFVPTGECTQGELAVFEKGLRDTRIVAAMPTAGTYSSTWFGNAGYQNVTIPLLQFTGSNDDNTDGAAISWAQTNGLDFIWIELEGGCHGSFDPTGCDTLDVAEGHRIINLYALAFSRVHLLGEDAQEITGIVAGTTVVSPVVVYRRK